MFCLVTPAAMLHRGIVAYLVNLASAAGTLSKVQLNVLARTQIPEVLFFIIFPHVAAMLQITGSLLGSADSLLLNF